MGGDHKAADGMCTQCTRGDWVGGWGCFRELQPFFFVVVVVVVCAVVNVIVLVVCGCGVLCCVVFLLLYP